MTRDNEAPNNHKHDVPEIYDPRVKLDLSQFREVFDNSGLDEVRKILVNNNWATTVKSVNNLHPIFRGSTMNNSMVTESFKMLTNSIGGYQNALFPKFNSTIYTDSMKVMTDSLNIWKNNKVFENAIKNMVSGIQADYKSSFNTRLIDSFKELTKSINNHVKLLPIDLRNVINSRLIAFGWAYPLELSMPRLYGAVYRCKNKEEFNRYMVGIYIRNDAKMISETLKLIEPLVSGRHSTIIKQMKKMMRKDIRNYVMCYQYLYSLLDYYCSEQMFNHTGYRPNINKYRLEKIVSADYDIEQNYQDVFENSIKLITDRYQGSDWTKVDSLEEVPLNRHSILHGKYIHNISFLEFIKLFNLTIFIIYMMSDENTNKSA